MYCHGCEFLNTLGIEYGLSCVVPSTKNSWNELTKIEQKSLIKSFYPRILTPLMELRNLVDSSQIRVYGYDERNLKYIIKDTREENRTVL